MSQQTLDYRHHLVLFVDDEAKTRKYFSKLFGKVFRIVLAEDGVAGLERFREYQDEIGVVITDQRMPNESGTEFLEKVALLKPNVVRILSTAFADIDAAVDSVNKGGIYRYITKPWEVPELEVTLRRAMELYMVRLEREELIRQKMMSVEILAASDRIISLAALSVFRNSDVRHVGEGLKAVVRIAEDHRSGPESIPAEGLSWRELYRRHLSFLGTVAAAMPAKLTEPASLSFDVRCSVRDVLEPVVAESDGSVAWADPRATPPDWPGPAEAMRDVVGDLIGTLVESLGGEGTVRLEECLSGLEIAFPARPLRKILQPSMSTSAEEPSRLALAVIAGFLRMAHFGCVFDLLPEPQSGDCRIRIGFDVSRVERAPSDPYEELAADLVGNELFWSRFVD
jgi:FixJ family two-component response regulator